MNNQSSNSKNNTHIVTSIFCSWPLFCFIKYLYTFKHYSYSTLEKWYTYNSSDNKPLEDRYTLDLGIKHSYLVNKSQVCICWVNVLHPKNMEIAHYYNFCSTLLIPNLQGLHSLNWPGNLPTYEKNLPNSHHCYCHQPIAETRNPLNFWLIISAFSCN